MTKAIYGVSNPAFRFGWGMTPSWLEEAVSNFGWVGFILDPLLIAGVCRFGDARHSVMVSLLTTVVACFHLAMHTAAFIPVLLLWLLMIFISHRSAHERLPQTVACES